MNSTLGLPQRTYLVSSTEHRLTRIVYDALEAIKLADHMSIIFDVKFTVAEYDDVWDINKGA